MRMPVTMHMRKVICALTSNSWQMGLWWVLNGIFKNPYCPSCVCLYAGVSQRNRQKQQKNPKITQPVPLEPCWRVLMFVKWVYSRCQREETLIYCALNQWLTPALPYEDVSGTWHCSCSCTSYPHRLPCANWEGKSYLSTLSTVCSLNSLNSQASQIIQPCLHPHPGPHVLPIALALWVLVEQNVLMKPRESEELFDVLRAKNCAAKQWLWKV